MYDSIHLLYQFIRTLIKAAMNPLGYIAHRAKRHKPLEPDSPQVKIEYFFEDEQQWNLPHASPFDERLVKIEENDHSLNENGNLEGKLRAQNQDFEQAQRKTKGLYQEVNRQRDDVSSLSSKASTVKRESKFQECSDVMNFSVFSYESDFKVFEQEMRQQDQSVKLEDDGKKVKIEGRKSRRAEGRKTRTTITTQKLQQVNNYFKEYFEYKAKGRAPPSSLKKIAELVGLSHSTILHKAGIYRKTHVLKPGKFLSSLTKKRKYKKSEECEKYIEQSLKIRPFYSAEALAKFILKEFKVFYPRAVIGRHLNELGYSSNHIKAFPLQKNGEKNIKLRKMYADIIEPLLDGPYLIIYIDEVAFSKNLFRTKNTYTPYEFKRQMMETEQDYVSVMVAISKQRVIHYHVREGFYQKEDFIKAIGQIYRNSCIQQYKNGHNSVVIINDMHKIHYDSNTLENDVKNTSIQQQLTKYGIKRYFLPPGSPQLNPVEILASYLKDRLFTFRNEINDCDTLKQKIVQEMERIANAETNRFFCEFRKWFVKALNSEPF